MRLHSKWKIRTSEFLITLVVTLCSNTLFAEDITVSYASLGAAYMDHVVAMEKGYALE